MLARAPATRVPARPLAPLQRRGSRARAQIASRPACAAWRRLADGKRIGERALRLQEARHREAALLPDANEPITEHVRLAEHGVHRPLTADLLHGADNAPPPHHHEARAAARATRATQAEHVSAHAARAHASSAHFFLVTLSRSRRRCRSRARRRCCTRAPSSRRPCACACRCCARFRRVS
jgi:hypothetical protein